MAPYLLEVLVDVFLEAPMRGLSARRLLLLFLVTALFVAGTLLVFFESAGLLSVGALLLVVAALVLCYDTLAGGRYARR